MTLPTLKESREMMTELDAYLGKKLRGIAERVYDDWNLVKFKHGFSHFSMDVEDTETWNFEYCRDDKGKKTWLLHDIAVIIDNDCAYCNVQMPIHEGSAMHEPLRALLLLAKAQGVKKYHEALPRKCKPQPRPEPKEESEEWEEDEA